MRSIKRFIFFIITLLIVSATLMFILENQRPMVLMFLGWSTPELSVAVLVILALLVGMVVGPAVASIALMRKKSKSSRLS
ncbi:hypothetical protein B723_14500 [Pseudomonas fluorescens NCIMB 11764]|uniref:Lipopolysaccharide assembly protein A domain-containing protein n=1 Tax=Pseudomonas fluorescens NCIMB 11764 TaxID=1221522 RepID=A0A0K1QPH6_PSEFL|nr:lipopolysaccharide assembly protein LapA domain-containing protein [Pseudomonas fluorescens]AKV07567.1 hypothetical protein B723_14500 [Pseudomonas fluorescens NCIMB 11764]